MNSKYRIGFLCAGAAFFLFITLAYKMTYDYTMDKYMEKVSERNEDVQKADGIGKTESIATEGEAVKGGAKKGFYLKELHGFVVVYLEDKRLNLPKYLCQIFRKKCARKLHRESKLQLQKNYMLF
ncbi:MAG: hypothetical protein ACLUFY_05600 [[Ruminococcus] torques]